MEAREVIAEIRHKIQQLETTFARLAREQEAKERTQAEADKAAARAAVRRICEAATVAA